MKKAMILAAGLGTRLRPWTLNHPKALVPVGGVPMLERVAENLREQGFDSLLVNVHHFGDQIIDFISQKGWRDIAISDESDALLDTGGGILRAEKYLGADADPFLIHNVDILSNADLNALMQAHSDSGCDCTLLVSDRDSSRKLIFDKNMNLKGWHSIADNRFRPQGISLQEGDVELAFSGIHVMSPTVFDEMRRLGLSGKFPVMDFYLHKDNKLKIMGVKSENLRMLDIGKPNALEEAETFLLNN